jgi:hypothetical protein
MKTTLQLSKIVNEDVCTYHGSLNFDSEEEYVLETREIPSDKLDDFWWSFSPMEQWKENLDYSMFEFLKPILKKYGYTVSGFSFYQPKFYNYEGDTLDISLEFEGNIDALKKTLKKELLDYLKNEREPSRDGYVSFEPETLEEVKADDHAILWAILKKEDLLGDENNSGEMADAFEDFRESAQENYSNIFDSALCDWAEKEGIEVNTY